MNKLGIEDAEKCHFSRIFHDLVSMQNCRLIAANIASHLSKVELEKFDFPRKSQLRSCPLGLRDEGTRRVEFFRVLIIAGILILSIVFSNQTAFSEGVNYSKPGIASTLVPKTGKIESKVFSLSDYIRTYPYTYSDTFVSVLSALPEASIAINSYDSSRGTINAELKSRKRLYILVVSSNDKSTLVRITPADGIYDIPNYLVTDIFDNIKAELLDKQ